MTNERLHQGPETPELEAVRHFRDGDRAAFSRIVHHWQASLFRIAYRIVGNDAAAEDIRLNLLLNLLASTVALPPPERFGSWIHRACCRNTQNAQSLRSWNHETSLCKPKRPVGS
jgi:DNA-directed RNA polymerase specialized sigma24 family protein